MLILLYHKQIQQQRIFLLSRHYPEKLTGQHGSNDGGWAVNRLQRIKHKHSIQVSLQKGSCSSDPQVYNHV